MVSLMPAGTHSEYVCPIAVPSKILCRDDLKPLMRKQLQYSTITNFLKAKPVTTTILALTKNLMMPYPLPLLPHLLSLLAMLKRTLLLHIVPILELLQVLLVSNNAMYLVYLSITIEPHNPKG